MRHIHGVPQHFCHAEVAHFHVVVPREEDVHGLDISVQDLQGVNVLQAKRCLHKVLPDLLL